MEWCINSYYDLGISNSSCNYSLSVYGQDADLNKYSNTSIDVNNKTNMAINSISSGNHVNITLTYANNTTRTISDLQASSVPYNISLASVKNILIYQSPQNGESYGTMNFTIEWDNKHNNSYYNRGINTGTLSKRNFTGNISLEVFKTYDSVGIQSGTVTIFDSTGKKVATISIPYGRNILSEDNGTYEFEKSFSYKG